MSRTRRRALLSLTALLAAYVSAGAGFAAQPALAPGFPVIAPSAGETLPVPGGRLVVASPMGFPEFGGFDDGVNAAFTATGRRVWQVVLRQPCGNCDEPAVPGVSNAGIIGPIG